MTDASLMLSMLVPSMSIVPHQNGDGWMHLNISIYIYCMYVKFYKLPTLKRVVFPLITSTEMNPLIREFFSSFKGMFGKHPRRGFLGTFRDPMENPLLVHHGKLHGGQWDSSFANIFKVSPPKLRVNACADAHCYIVFQVNVDDFVFFFFCFLVSMGHTIKI